MKNLNLKRYLANWHGEVDSAAQYRAMASAEKSKELSQVYNNLAAIEEKHRDFWEVHIQKAGGLVPQRRPTWRAQVLILLARLLGPDAVLNTISEGERADKNQYAPQTETQGTSMLADEHGHDRILGEILNTQTEGASGTYLANLEGRHKSLEGNTLRAAVMGANDGLCSNFSLVMGVAGASLASHALLLTGLAGLLAGACSMALGEWLSVTNSRELSEREISIEESEYDLNPEGEREELELIYESKGMSPDQAEKLADLMISDKHRAIDALTREELGIDPQEKGGSPWTAAIISFFLFSTGAIVPVFPFFFLTGSRAIAVSAGLSALALFLFGALTTLFTGKPVLFAGTRQLVMGLLAAAATFGLGHLLGVSLS